MGKKIIWRDSIVTQDEITRYKEKVKNYHVEANYLNQLIWQDTFYIDCFSSFGVAKIRESSYQEA